MSLANYEFLPWLKEGLGNVITERDTLTQGGTAGGRAVLTLGVDINQVAAGTKDFQLVGPADVIGFSRDMVIRTEPVNWSTSFASNLLAHIEFYGEDFPWRYTPAKADGEKLRPWISLIVLKETEFSRKEALVPLPQIEIADPSVLPVYGDTWLWAHVQKIGASTLASDKAASDHIISRLICPRKLEANTRYYAFVIPTFESGRLAGLGKSEGEISNALSMDPAWGLVTTAIVFPVYYEWFFRTADDMDFEYMASLLEARPTDALVGRKPLDCSNPGFGIPGYQDECTLYMEGALKSPDTIGAVSITNESAVNLADFEKRIKQLLDMNLQTGGDPVVVPVFYGQKHIFENSLSLTDTKWIHQLNRNPAYRAVAGLGGNVFRKYQDLYLQKAWEQLESIVEANKIIDAANSNLAVCQALYEKNIAGLGNEEMIAFAGPVHVKVKTRDANGNEHSLLRAFRDSCYNGSVYTAAFRRLTARRNSFMRKLEQGGGKLDLKLLRSTLIARTNAPYKLLPANKYKVLVIDRPVFQVVFRPAFEERWLALSPQDLDQVVNAFAAVIRNPPDKTPCEKNIRHKLPENINPSLTIPGLLSQVLGMPVAGWFDDPLNIKAALAYPDFEDPLVEKLKELSTEWLAPNLHLIPNNTVTLLQPNRKFIEAFMVGVNVAMNQEMRWREYPTDERASCFRQFWDVKGMKDVNDPALDPAQAVEQFKDITPIHTWKNWKQKASEAKLDEFGAHNTRSQLPENDQLVLVIKGDLLKCFPNTAIYAVEADEQTASDGSKKLVIKPGGTIKLPQFKAEAGPDLKFIGFELTVAAAKGIAPNHGWFFVLQETPGETRFGLDSQLPATTASSWDDASWKFVNGNYISADDDFSPIMNNMGTGEQARWRRTSADMAYILYQKPVMIAIHANEMLT